MDNNRTLKLEALLKVANAKKQAVTKVPVSELLQYAKSRQTKRASAQPPNLYCRLVASMAKTAEQEAEKKESPKADSSKPEPTKSESSKSQSSKSAPASTKPAAQPAGKPAATAPKPATPHPATPKPASPPPATAMQGASPGFDWQSILKTLQPYAAPTAVGAGVGALGSLMLPQGTNPGESAQQYQRRQRNRMIGGGMAGSGTAAALLAAYNAYKTRKGLVSR